MHNSNDSPLLMCTDTPKCANCGGIHLPDSHFCTRFNSSLKNLNK